MLIDRSTPLFFDATCLIAAAGSPSGGSSFLLWLCQQGFFPSAVSRPVLVETRRNIATKLPAPAMTRYRALRRSVLTWLVPVAEAPARREYGALVTEKDAHVLAAALNAQAPYLLTLDRRLLQRVNDAGLLVQAYTPKAFIETVLPAHPDFARMRS